MAPKRFQILALSGGGYRGLYTAELLRRLEEENGGQPIGRRFDLIAGTSIGGILALAVACEIPASRLVEVFETQGHLIFARRGFAGALSRVSGFVDSYVYGLVRSRYSHAGLRDVLADETVFGGNLLDHCLHPVIVPAVNYSTGTTRVFKTPHHENNRQDYRRSLVDVALATSAAPVFFPHHVIDDQIYVDGGLVANGPALLGLHEAETLFGRSAADIHVLSIGTIETSTTASTRGRLNKGILPWGKDLFALTIAAQERLLNQMLSHRVTEERHVRIDTRLEKDQASDIGLDVVSPSAIRALKGQAANAFQWIVNDRRLREMLLHESSPGVFFHGKRATN
ncbi:MAG TPA: CBASS cGAMP-activated phospholipase [Gammaproteobacteria bacterium]|nr:CBASS cGAMP-activated phospholipase [Gammaproteobacteria bacterium]